MTSIFTPDGRQTACTIIEAGPCVVTQVKTKETDGYTAVQLGFGDKTEKHSNKPEINHFSKSQTAPKSTINTLSEPQTNKERLERNDYCNRNEK